MENVFGMHFEHGCHIREQNDSHLFPCRNEEGYKRNKVGVKEERELVHIISKVCMC